MKPEELDDICKRCERLHCEGCILNMDPEEVIRIMDAYDPVDPRIYG